jgi:8-oxo-dGTP diphosphatase
MPDFDANTGRTPSPEQTVSERRYPARPVVAVSGVVIVAGGGVVLVRRRHPPLLNAWSLPGGVLEIGEPLREGVAREVREETGLAIEAGPVVDVVEHIEHDAAGRVTYHYVIVDYLCRVTGGVAAPAGDATEVAVVGPSGLAMYELLPRTMEVIERASRMAASGW